ncbi:MAG: anthranilate phosphoribosyltransferase [Pyrinomonadaceae bacterium]
MYPELLRSSIELFPAGESISGDDLVPFFDELMQATDENLLSHVMTSWTRRGISEDELFGLASLMRSRCTPVTSPYETFVDAVGTGGSKVKTFNVSTAAAFVIAGAGVPVAKHGNRAASSNSGSADVLSELAIEPAVSAETAERCLAEIGICFMFAPNFHRLSPVLGSVRRRLGFPTVFNMLGPLCNPAGAPHQVIGVWDEALIDIAARVISRLGTKHSWVVHGTDGLDEITLSAKTSVAEIRDSTITMKTVEPADFDLSRRDLGSMRASSPSESAAMVRSVLTNTADLPEATDLVLINAASAIHIATGNNLEDSTAMARESIESGAAADKLRKLGELTKK